MQPVLALLLLALPLQDAKLNASGGELIPEQACFDVKHYALELAVDPDARSIDGMLWMRAGVLADTNRIALDLDPHLTAHEVSGEGVAGFEHADGRVMVDFAEPLSAGAELQVGVKYGGQPRVAPRPPWDGGLTWAKTADGRPWIATSCQGEGADLWWPCKDHPSDKPESMELSITVPKGLVCASNGVLDSIEDEGDGLLTYNWKVSSPISNYAVALNIAPYVAIEDSWESVGGETVPVVFYALPESVEKARERLPELIDHMRFFEELLGPYPFRAEKYGIAETPHLGMEHQTIIAYGYKFQHNAFGYDWLHHHEAAHEWWANLVTCSDWKDMWIHEGFGTYMQALYVERLHGKKGLRRELVNSRRGMGNRRPVAPRETKDSKEIYFDRNGVFDNDIYMKGSLILHTLRWEMGDEAFFRALKRFAYPDAAHRNATDGSQVRLVDTEDFRAVAEAEAGRDLGWFFEVYLRQPKLPVLHAERDGETVALRWELPEALGDLEFPLAVPLRVGDGDDAVTVRVEMPGGATRYRVPADRDFRVDPDLWLLRK